MTTDTPSGATAPTKRTRKSPTAPKSGAAPGKVAVPKETPAEAALHELFRCAHLDTRSVERLRQLVRVAVGLILAIAWVQGALSTEHSGLLLGMGMAIDLTGWTVTAPGAAGAAMAAFAGDPTNIRNSDPGKLIRMVGAWSKSQATGFSQIVYPSGHDTTRNLRFENVANQPGNMFPRGIAALQKAQDLLTVTQAGSAVAGDVELVHPLIHYEDLPGIEQKLISFEDVQGRAVRPVTFQGTLTAAASGAWSGATAISAFTQFLRGNTQYAWLGYKLSAVCGAIALSGPSTGNLHVGGPGLTSPDNETVNWFTQLAEWHGLPMIPTWNTADNAGTFLSISQDENLTAVVFSLFLMELANG